MILFQLFLLEVEAMIGAVIACSEMQTWISPQVEQQAGGTFSFDSVQVHFVAVK